MLIKFGFSESLFYPSLFVLFLFIRRIIKFVLEVYLLQKKLSYILVLIMFIFEIVIGFIFLYNRNKKKDNSVTSEFMGIPLIKEVSTLKRPDSNLKVIVLIIFASHFEIIGAISRRYLTNNAISKESNLYDEYHAKYRSSEIIIASILCFFTLKMKIYKHHTFSLIFILICLIVIYIIEIKCGIDNFMYCIFILVSSICRVFLDTIEKYLFDTDFVDIYKITIFEGIIDSIFTCCLFFFDVPKDELMKLINNTIDDKDEAKGLLYWIGILLLFAYGAFSGLKNISRRYTVKKNSPMTRALAESILDPIFILYGYLNRDKNQIKSEDNEKQVMVSFIVTFICSILMVFCSCVYNEIFVLFCCGLERKTHLYVLHTNSNLELAENDNKNSSLDDSEQNSII
jgi:hypothetical protein